jgi:tetratricopeptide (TPR) repeat protein
MSEWGEAPEAEQQENWLQLVEDLLGQTEQAGNPSERAAILCKAAEVYERRLGDSDNALVALQAAFREDPSSGQVVQELERLARSNAKWREVITSTTEVVEDITDPKQAADLWVQMAFWCDTGLNRMEEAATAASAALALDPTHGGALALLEDLYRRQRSWDNFVEVLDRKWGTPYRDHYKIAEAYAEALKFEPEHRGALAGMARLCEETGQWDRAADMLHRLAAVASPHEQIGIQYRLGKIWQTELKDPRAAEEHFVHALALDPETVHVPCMLALMDVYKQRGDWLKAAQLILRVQDHIADAAEKVRLIFEAAQIFHQKLDDQTQAADLYGLTLMLEPAHPEAREPLADIYFKRGDWAALLPVAEGLAENVEGKPPQKVAALFHRIGKAAHELGDDTKAVESYRRSFAADPTYLPTLHDWGALAYERKDWAEASQLYGALLAQQQKPRRDELLETLIRLGMSKLRLGHPEDAVGLLDKALTMDNRNRATLEALVEAYTEAGNWPAVIQKKHALLAWADGVDGQVAIHEEMAAIYREKLGDAQKAIAGYFAALELKPDAHTIMHKVLDLLTETKQWKQAVQVLMRLAELSEGQARARYLVAAGNILNYEMNAVDEAVDLYNRALDVDPDDLKTFERIDKLLTANKEWKSQERCYRKQIIRMGLEPAPEKKVTLLALWQGLGEIYRSRLKDFPAAIAAFEVCVGLEPDVPSRRTILAELYQLAGPDTYEKAVAEYRLLLKSAPTVAEMVPHLKLLLRLFVELVQYERAWCVSQALVFLGKADVDEQQLYEQYRPRAFVMARSRLTEEMWQRYLYHAEEDRLVSQILATVSHGVCSARAKEHKEWGLKRKDRRDVAKDPLLFSKVLSYVSQVLNVAWPEVYLAPDSPGEIDLANARHQSTLAPAFVVGRDLLQGRSEAEIAYLVAKNLAMMRPDHLVRWPSVVPTVAELKVVFVAALQLVNPAFPVQADMQAPVGQYLEYLRKVTPPQLVEQLSVVVERFIATKVEVDISRWARAVYLTATRAGFLVCNDLETSARLGQAASAQAGIIDPGEVVRDLVEFSVSNEYFTLRAHLGLGAG